MQLSELVREWLERAAQDAATARFLLDMRPRPNEIIGFHAQQAVEKGLKAIIANAGIAPPRTHDLVYLHHACEQQAGIDVDDLELCSRLSPFAVEHRYPVQAVVAEDQLLDDVEKATAILNRIRRLLEHHEP